MSRRGNVVLSLMFMMLVAAAGLGLLTRTGLHFRIVAARRERRLEGAFLEQALVLCLHRYRERLAAADMNAFPEPERDFFNNQAFPDPAQGTGACSQRFERRTLLPGPDFRVVRILDLIRACRGGGRLAYVGRAGVDLYAGDVPAGEFALAVRQPNEGSAAAFLAGRGVEYPGSLLPQVGDYDVSSDGEGLLREALKLPVPDWRRIRERFGLEPSDAPVPRGVYLAGGDEGEVAAVFVQGDLEKLEFGADGGWQAVAFIQDGRRSELRYQPGLPSLEWSGGDGPAAAGSTFAEKIVVHGSVRCIEQAGAAAFLPEARIELLASGCLVIRSGLAGENLETGGERIPCLLLMTSGRDLFDGEAVAADVVVEGGGDKVIQAQVIAAGTLVNGGGRTEITGGLFAGDVENPGRLRVAGAAGGFALPGHVRLRNFKFLKNFRVHFIQEEGDEG
jgi:hypothetical protein